eukprot:s3511_g4.t1
MCFGNTILTRYVTYNIKISHCISLLQSPWLWACFAIVHSKEWVGDELHIKKPMKFKVSVCAQHLYEGLRKYTEKFGPTIMSSIERAVVKYSERTRPIVVEQDLEGNFPLLKEATLSCFEQMLKDADLSDCREIPILAEFEAAFLLLSLRSNFHVEHHTKRGGKGLIRESWSSKIQCLKNIVLTFRKLREEKAREQQVAIEPPAEPQEDNSHLEVELDDEPIIVAVLGNPGRMVKAETEEDNDGDIEVVSVDVAHVDTMGSNAHMNPGIEEVIPPDSPDVVVKDSPPEAFNAFMGDGKKVWVDSQPDPARPARSHVTLNPPEALELPRQENPSLRVDVEPKPEGLESTPIEPEVDELETASITTNKSEHPPEPKRKKAKAKETKECLIPNPPQLPEAMAKRAKQLGQSFAASGVVEVNLDEQRQLKKKLEEEAKELAEQKKQTALDKKQMAADKAIQKLEKKLRDAQAKAAQLQSKAHGKTAKRKLDADFASVADPGQSGPPPSPAAKKNSRSKKPNPSPNQKSPSFKLSPKARSFATGSTKPSPKDATQNRATAALTLLREKKLRDLTLPPMEFSKKNLGCNTAAAFFVGKANAQRAEQLLQRECYPSGGIQIGWEGGLDHAWLMARKIAMWDQSVVLPRVPPVQQHAMPWYLWKVDKTSSPKSPQVEGQLCTVWIHLLDWIAQSKKHAAAQGFDLSQDPVLQDVTLLFGFLQALAYVLRIQVRGLAWLALPCNSFTFVSSSQHQRSWDLPYGCGHYGWVWMGNCICARTCLLLLVATARSVTWFLENPLRSAVHVWPYLNFLMGNSWLNTRRTSWMMGYYGGWSVKPQLGLSNATWAGYLYESISKDDKKKITEKARALDKQMVKVTVNKQGTKKVVSGGRDMKSSQQYPIPFGERIAALHLGFMNADPAKEPTPDLAGFIKNNGFQEPPQQCWVHAQLEPFLDFVHEAIRSGRMQPDPLVPIQIEPSAMVAELARQRALLEG